MTYITYSGGQFGQISETQLAKLLKVSGDDLIAEVAAEINQAESLVNGYAGQKYSLPLPDSPLPGKWTLALAEYEIYKRGPGGNVPAKIRDSFEDTMKQLRDLAKGDIALPVGDDGSEPELKIGAAVKVASNTQIMNDDIYGY